MDDAERNRIADQALARIAELFASTNPDAPLPPDVEAEIHTVLAKGRELLGPLPPDQEAEVFLILEELRVLKEGEDGPLP